MNVKDIVVMAACAAVGAADAMPENPEQWTNDEGRALMRNYMQAQFALREAVALFIEVDNNLEVGHND